METHASQSSGRPVNNDIYDELGERWYTAQDDPVALLRAEARHRTPWLLERMTALLGPRSAVVHLRASHKPQVGTDVDLPGGARARVVARVGELTEVELDREIVPFLEAHGETPLPPYISRAADATDRERYQTVFARAPGAVAAPTAGLHFDLSVLDALAAQRIERTFLTLHVGAGTFAPVRTERIEDHELHAEWLEVTAAACASIERCRERGGRVVAVGTTTVRALETAARGGKLDAGLAARADAIANVAVQAGDGAANARNSAHQVACRATSLRAYSALLRVPERQAQALEGLRTQAIDGAAA